MDANVTIISYICDPTYRDDPVTTCYPDYKTQTSWELLYGAICPIVVVLQFTPPQNTTLECLSPQLPQLAMSSE